MYKRSKGQERWFTGLVSSYPPLAWAVVGISHCVSSTVMCLQQPATGSVDLVCFFTLAESGPGIVWTFIYFSILPNPGFFGNFLLPYFSVYLICAISTHLFKKVRFYLVFSSILYNPVGEFVSGLRKLLHACINKRAGHGEELLSLASWQYFYIVDQM